MTILTEQQDNPTPGEQPASTDALLPVVYDHLRVLAQGYLRRQSSDFTLQPTALVHEAYMAMARQEGVEWEDETHFYRVAAVAMRNLVIDHVRRRTAVKRGGAAISIELRDSDGSADEVERVDLLALDEALRRLEAFDPIGARIIEYRYFAGLGVNQVAEIMGISRATLQRQWRAARAWLYTELHPAS